MITATPRTLDRPPRRVEAWFLLNVGGGEIKLIGETAGWAGEMDGTDVITSRVVDLWNSEAGLTARTASGSLYLLGTPEAEWVKGNPTEYEQATRGILK